MRDHLGYYNFHRHCLFQQPTSNTIRGLFLSVTYGDPKTSSPYGSRLIVISGSTRGLDRIKDLLVYLPLTDVKK